MQKTKVTEYDSSSDEEICEAEDLVEECTSGGSTVDSFCKAHRNSLNLGLPTVTICKDSSSLLEKDKN